MREKTAKTAGADEKTPSKAQYFSWINNTNEGSTERQTLINLAYFDWLKREYGMQLDIYAWDAGNLDGSRGTYERLTGDKLKKQYPRGYAPVARAADAMGVKLGVWCGPDGFGDTAESEKDRYDLMVSLCRDYHFGLFKMDSVCGNLRRSKIDVFIEMMKECRSYSPDLILLNHRLNFGKAEPYSTTTLLGGDETYVDVHICNTTTAMHHRAFAFGRKGVPGLRRLTEDHGVCISSCVDYFEDDLIIQAFGRCLVLAPEIYANPWLLRDDEQAHLARIYNLHRSYRDILVNGMELPECDFGPNAVARGDGKTRFITAGNCSWEVKKIRVKLDKSIGLEECDRAFVASHHPFERVYGEFSYGQTLEIEVMPFRAVLLHIAACDSKPAMLTGCEYEVLHEQDGKPDRIKLVKADGKVTGFNGEVLYNGEAFDNTNRPPVLLGTAKGCATPSNTRELLECAYYAVDADSLEKRSLVRSGDTKIPEVKAARDAFFNQDTYVLRGCESRYAFDGNDSTYFDAATKIIFGGMRIKGGCLRVDFGSIYDADSIVIEYFNAHKPDNKSVAEQNVPVFGEYAVTLSEWSETGKVHSVKIREDAIPVIIEGVHCIKTFTGERKQAVYAVGGKIRYFQIPEPMDRIFGIFAVKDGKRIETPDARVTNVMPSVKRVKVHAVKRLEAVVPTEMYRDGCYLSIGINGKHGDEGVTAVVRCSGSTYGCPDRAPSYQCNAFECPARHRDSCYTYYLPVARDMCGEALEILVLYLDKRHTAAPAEVYLCDGNGEKKGIKLKL